MYECANMGNADYFGFLKIQSMYFYLVIVVYVTSIDSESL